MTLTNEFDVGKLVPDITVTVENKGPGEDAVFTVTSNAEGSVNVTINGVTTDDVPTGEPVENDEGETIFIATIVVPGINSGIYPYTVHYSGNDNYEERDVEGSLTVSCDHENGYPEYMIDEIITEVTDTEDGEVKLVCPVCSDEKNGTVPALGNGWADTAQSTATIDGEELKCIVQDPYRVLPDGTALVIRHIEPGERFDELSAKLDDTHAAEKIEFFEIELLDSQGNKLPMPLNYKVRVLLQIPDGMDKDEIQVVLVNAGDDVEFEETLVYKVYDAGGNFIKTVDKDYEPEDGETVKVFAAVWTDHFSPYALIDALNDREAFDEYKEDKKDEIDALAQEGDSEAVKELIDKAKEDIDALEYEEENSLEDNKAAADAIVGKLKDDIAEHRKEYTATFVADGETVKEIKFTIDTGSVEAPSVPEKTGYTGKWESYSLGAKDITVNAVYTPLKYTAKFIADGKTVAEVQFTVETESITEPAVPEKAGYTGEWSKYTLGASDIEINAVYTEIPAEPATPDEPATKTEPATETEPATPDEPATETEPDNGNLCPLDGTDHGTTFMGKIIKFFHSILWSLFRLIGLDVHIRLSWAD